jgi:hypothetical protein
MSLEGPVFSSLLESVNGMEAQPATVDATVIKNVPPRIQADRLLTDIGNPNSRLGVPQVN